VQALQLRTDGGENIRERFGRFAAAHFVVQLINALARELHALTKKLKTVSEIAIGLALPSRFTKYCEVASP
jgi:hypothetical protein